jgi:hypothetical protein
MISYLYSTFPVCVSEYVSRDFQLCISEFPAMYLEIIPLLYRIILIFYQNYSVLITEFVNCYRICYYRTLYIGLLYCSGNSAECEGEGYGFES